MSLSKEKMRDSGSGTMSALAIGDPAHQLLRDAAAAAVRDADDHFLADVAALRKRDRAILDAGLERDGVLVHVGEKPRHAALDANHLERVEVDLRQRAEFVGQRPRRSPVDESVALNHGPHGQRARSRR